MICEGLFIRPCGRYCFCVLAGALVRKTQQTDALEDAYFAQGRQEIEDMAGAGAVVVVVVVCSCTRRKESELRWESGGSMMAGGMS